MAGVDDDPRGDGRGRNPMTSGPRSPELTILYRGPLASCNYDCPYCPFAKRRDSPATLRADRAALARFVDWVARNPHGHRQLSILFTPWGEALTRSWYRDALVTLSHLPHVGTVAVQTNLSCRTGWLAAADPTRLALWCTYHPGETTRERFVARTAELDAIGIRHSVGIVGLADNLDAARDLRAALPQHTYLWVNAEEGRSYDPAEEAVWTALDPLFAYSAHPHPSVGLPCRTGESVISVDGDGLVRRCHFVAAPLGNLYDGTYLPALRPRPCPNTVCDCHIGYVHLETLPLYEVFAGGIVERIPTDCRDPAVVC
ncbi:STM4011 family radical SAM protein [Rhodococcus sp. NPDC060086]|uniref:STM4011 family radical SAM protein n=1 Tax=Rhodococcus sp. NPDC060086 TaxID=3347055 RepID=UPI003646D7DD